MGNEQTKSYKQIHNLAFDCSEMTYSDKFTVSGILDDSDLVYAEEIAHQRAKLIYYDRNSELYKRTLEEELPSNPAIFALEDNLGGFLLRNLEIYNFPAYDLPGDFFLANKVMIYWNYENSLRFPEAHYHSKSIQIRIDDDKCPDREIDVIIYNRDCPIRIDVFIYGTGKSKNLYNILCDNRQLIKITIETKSMAKIYHT